MPRIYISSTYNDLREAREAVYHVLRKARYDVIAMEDYVASDKRPVDKCLGDVGDCDVYIGIFAWRYGYIPPDQECSITELEFRKAQQSKIPRLVFLLHEEAPWPRNLMDGDTKRIEALRAELRRERIVDFFRTSDELATKVILGIGEIEKNVSAEGHAPDNISKLVSELIHLVERTKDADHKTHRQQARHALLQDQVATLFTAFEAVHAQYLSSFSKYRQILKIATDPLTSSHPIIDIIRSENLFKEHERTKILGLGNAADDPEIKKFVRLIHDYLVDVRVVADPIAGYQGKRFANPQHWRRTLIAELEAIFEERWQVVLDPNSARPPLYGVELEEALTDACQQEGIKGNDARKLDKLKQAFAVRALDAIVEDMQEAYSEVANEYARLQQILSR